MTAINKNWDVELEYSRQAIRKINLMEPRPLFCCVCGDLVDIDEGISPRYGFTVEECGRIKDEENKAFIKTWADLNDEIPLVCLCGNHDVGDRPNKASIERFTKSFGDDYLAFWVNGTYNIVLNTNIFFDPKDTEDLFQEQLEWLQERLQYARDKQASGIFVFGHHPWFLYDEEEDKDDMKGLSEFPDEFPVELRGGAKGVPDWYFPIPKKYRKEALSLFKEYDVAAAFAGHFHQNMVSKASWGMDMIVTSALSGVFGTSARPKDFNEPTTQGFRVVDVETNDAGSITFRHRFEPLI